MFLKSVQKWFALKIKVAVVLKHYILSCFVCPSIARFESLGLTPTLLVIQKDKAQYWKSGAIFRSLVLNFSFYCSAFMIGEGRLLTNAHCVEHGTQVIFKVIHGSNYVNMSSSPGYISIPINLFCAIIILPIDFEGRIFLFSGKLKFLYYMSGFKSICMGRLSQAHKKCTSF